MEIELATIGGYSEVGKNMTALRVDDEVVIFDMGLYLPKIIGQEEEIESLDAQSMIKKGAIPDDNVISKWKGMVKAIVLGHAHLDHVGAIPYLADKYGAPIYGTPFTIEVLKEILHDKEVDLRNEIKTINPNGKVKISDKIEIEFINMTHSTPQTAMILVHTPKGTVIYANDFKFDNHPVLGKKPNYERLRSLDNVLALVADSLYSGADLKTPSERVARELLKDVLLGTDNKGHLVIVTTFASHLARLRSIIDFGKKMGRKIVFLGRSLNKYVQAGENAGIVNFSKEVEIVAYRAKIQRKLMAIKKDNPSKYLIVCTGNQAEPGSVLDRIVKNEMNFRLKPGDHVIFSCKTIPDPINIENRAKMERGLRKMGVRMFKEIHVSGHCAREDLRDLITMTKPKHIIPAHGEYEKTHFLGDLAKEMGYKKNFIHVVNDGDFLRL